MMTQLALTAIGLPGTGNTTVPVSYPTPQFTGPFFTNIGGILNDAVPLILALAGLGLLLMLLFAGFTFMTSAGDAKKMEQAKSRLTNALVGFIIVFAAYWVVQLVGVIFKLQSITTIFGK
jgi:hypothetical protein